ncbi:hypothetical protein FQZ97_651030 [compost metagenome]
MSTQPNSPAGSEAKVQPCDMASFTARPRAPSSRMRTRSEWRRSWPWSMHHDSARSNSVGEVSVASSLVSSNRSLSAGEAARKPMRQLGARIFAKPLT